MKAIEIRPAIVPELDPHFIPAGLWTRAYGARVSESSAPVEVALVLVRPDGSCLHHRTRVLPLTAENESLNFRHLERMIKFLLWQRGASTVLLSGCASLVPKLAAVYTSTGERYFDARFFGESVYGQPLEIAARDAGELPRANESALSLGGHLDGCRIGFDLGGSDRKCAAVIDGKVVFSEEIPWNPYFETDPRYHIDGINDSLQRAAAHLPRVDAIGGSAAGIYVKNEVRVASLFRGVSPADFETHVRRIFLDLRERWGNVPFEVVNDGEVTALAGSLSLRDGALLGVAMGTSEAAGYCDPEGRITSWLNELAFAPVDYRADAPIDEWSGDRGCGVQYFSQQAVARLAGLAGIEFAADTPFAEQLVRFQELMGAGDERARKIFETIGVYLGYTLVHYADFYEIRNAMILGRVTSGAGGDIILGEAEKVLRTEFPEHAGRIRISTPDEKMKRHGQAIAAASLPAIG